MESRDSLLSDLGQCIATDKAAQVEAENALKELQVALAEAELKRERIVHANGALQDSLAAAEAKEKNATVCYDIKNSFQFKFKYRLPQYHG